MANDSLPLTPARMRALRSETPVTVGRFRLEEQRFVQLDGRGDVINEATTDGLSLALVQRRDLGCMAVLLGMAATMFGGLWAVAGGYGASAALCPVLFLLFLAFMAFLKGEKLEVTTAAKTQVWAIHSEASALELELLIARVNRAGSASNRDEHPPYTDVARALGGKSTGGFKPHQDMDWYRPSVLELTDEERMVAVTASSLVQAQHIIHEVCFHVRAALEKPTVRPMPLVMNINAATLPESESSRALLEAAAEEATALNEYRPAQPFAVSCIWSGA